MDLDRAVRLLSKLSIRDRDSGKIVPFRLNPNQHKTVELLKQRQRERKPLWFFVLKSRRVGMSSLVDGLGLCQAIVQPALPGLIVAHLDTSVSKLFEVPKRLVEGLRKHVPSIPMPIADRITIPHPEGDSVLEIATAGSVSGGRGAAYFFLHCSESAFWKSAEAFTSLLNTVPRSMETILCVESTANGRVGQGEAFFKLWKDAESGRSDFMPVFLSWLDDPGCILDPIYLERIRIDADALAEEAELIKHFNARPEQLAWRRWTLMNKCGGFLDTFWQEYPHTASCAFISSGNPAFLSNEMGLARASVETPIFIGSVDRDSTGIKFIPGGQSLFVWEKYVPGQWYYIGVDAARGQVEGDFAAIAVINGTTNALAALYLERISPDALAKVVNMLGRSYGKAMVNIELTGNLGLWALKVLRDDLRYPNLYRRKGRDDKFAQKQSAQIGWETNNRTRELLFTAYREAIREHDLKVKSEIIVSQMDTAQRDADRINTKGNDDALFSIMLANIAVLQYPPPKRLGTKSPMKEPLEQDSKMPAMQGEASQALIAHRKLVERYTKFKKIPHRGLDGV